MSFKSKIRFINIFKWTPISWIWNFPSLLIGSIVLLYSIIRAKKLGTKVYKRKTDGITWFQVDPLNPVYGVSLFPFIILSDQYTDLVTIHHEAGHLVQATLMSSWIYLLIVGIPSGTSNIPVINKLLRGREYNTEYQYYGFENRFDFWWECQADKFGNVLHLSYYPSHCIRYLSSSDI